MRTMYKLAAIPTLYRGVQFRSRLEARWAVMFDLMGWSWDYEPFDAQGYIPDFRINEQHPTIIEVKPIGDILDSNGFFAWGQWEAVAKKIRAAGIQDFTIVGSKPHDVSHLVKVSACLLGTTESYYEHEDGRREPTLSAVPMGLCLAEGCGIFSPSIYRCMSCGKECTEAPFKTIDNLWKAAGNAVQYKGGK